MPIHRTYKGLPVTRISRTPSGVLLTFANERPGERHEKTTITQEEWKLHGTEQFVKNEASVERRTK